MTYNFKDLMALGPEAIARDGYYRDWTHLDPEVFYSLTQISEYIKTKGYGVDVRLLIAQLAEHFGLKYTQVVDLANLLQQKFTNLEGVTQSFTSNINSLVAQMEADKNAVIANATVDSEVILARGGKATLGDRLDETTAQLAQTKPIKYLEKIPTINDLNSGELGVLIKEQVRLQILNTSPVDGAKNINVDSILYFDVNMPIDEETLTSNYVRLWDGTEKVPLIVTFDKKNNRILIIPTPLGARLKENTHYKLEITDSVKSTQGYNIGAGLHRVNFTTGTAQSLTFNEPFTNYEGNDSLTVTVNSPATVNQQSGHALIDTTSGGYVSLIGDEASRIGPYTVSYRIKPIQLNGVLQLRVRMSSRDYIVGINPQGEAYDFRESNVLNKRVQIDLDDFVTVTLSVDSEHNCHAWVNGEKIPYLVGGNGSGSNVSLIANQPMLFELHSVKGGLFFLGDVL